MFIQSHIRVFIYVCVCVCLALCRREGERLVFRISCAYVHLYTCVCMHWIFRFGRLRWVVVCWFQNILAFSCRFSRSRLTGNNSLLSNYNGQFDCINQRTNQQHLSFFSRLIQFPIVAHSHSDQSQHIVSFPCYTISMQTYRVDIW